jgi:hypothetical protein
MIHGILGRDFHRECGTRSAPFPLASEMPQSMSRDCHAQLQENKDFATMSVNEGLIENIHIAMESE